MIFHSVWDMLLTEILFPFQMPGMTRLQRKIEFVQQNHFEHCLKNQNKLFFSPTENLMMLCITIKEHWNNCFNASINSKAIWDFLLPYNYICAVWNLDFNQD